MISLEDRLRSYLHYVE